MAKPGEMAELIAAQFGAEGPTVRQQARVLRDAGLLSKERGGRGAGSMTARDAAHLLIAAAGRPPVSKSASLIERPGGLRSHGDWGLTFLPLPELNALPDDHTFADAVEALVLAAANGSLQTAANRAQGGIADLIRDLTPTLNIEVTVGGPLPRGSISFEVLGRDENGNPERDEDAFEQHYYGTRRTRPGAGNLARFDFHRTDEMGIDLRANFTFTHRTIMVVGRLLAGEAMAGETAD